MKKLVTIALGLALLAGVVNFAKAEDDADAAKKKEAAKARRAELIKKYDKNGDGKLDAEEREAMRKDREAKRHEGQPKKEEKKDDKK